LIDIIERIIDDVRYTNVCEYFNVTQIERWWRELHWRLEKYFKHQLLMLKDQGYYNPDDDNDRYVNNRKKGI
jgi:hypothetical protein